MLFRVTLFLLGIVCAEAVGGLLGGLVDVDVDREGVAKTALEYAITHHNRISNDLMISNMTELVSAQKQVVSGIKYHFTVKMVKTSCRKGSSIAQCEVPAGAQTYECNFKVWVQPWLNREPVVTQECTH
ncbi:cystatin C (amyloid angiopathy and cerebral hemorrhage) [Corythoichthys intestinalis]|uniref:cystatin C (amyloid angiopathy and cerebral hemorrhage) n=1 Tax=Corythoichthys intestinalis TaxID=161448 RepID=UPI0025A61D19|nr:cystatin C (amyloid angiopathy and cerebral hemorrhage) [Corythoichthys intestinalis]